MLTIKQITENTDAVLRGLEKKHFKNIHEGLYGETDLRFTDQLPLDEIDVLFFCTAHGGEKFLCAFHQFFLRSFDLSHIGFRCIFRS